MTVATLIARLLLAAVFAVAGVTKLADRGGTRQATTAFGVPDRLAGPVALILPIAELAVAALLLFPSTAVYGASGALVLLAVFSAAIGWNLAHGRAPDCHCFGQLHSAPASWKTLARNGVLAAIAVVALVGTVEAPGASAVGWIGDLGAFELLALLVAVAAIVVLAVGAVAFFTLMRSYGRVLVRLDRLESALADAGIDLGGGEPTPEIGLEPGSSAPVFAELDGLLEPGLPVLLLFTSPNCGPCETLIPQAAEWQRERADVVTVAFASDGDAEDVRAEAEKFELEHVLVDGGRRISDSYQANGTPSAVLIAPDGTIASWLAPGTEWIERLVESVTAGAGNEGLSIGAEAPEIELLSLDGEPAVLADLHGHATMLLFWNPDCGFCRSMHDDLLAWEESANGVAPRLVVVSSGDEKSTRAEGFRSLVLLDEDFSASAAFQANGTPMAVLIDADGHIASGLAAGAEEVLALMRSDESG